MVATSSLDRLKSSIRVGLFTSVFLILELVSKLVINPFIGYSINLKVIWYVFVLLSSAVDQRAKLLFAFLAPVMSLVFGFSGINFFQVVFEYLFAYWGMLFLTLYHSKPNPTRVSRFLNAIWLFLIVTLAFFINFLFHFLAGLFWWTNFDYWACFILNFNYIVVSYLVGLPLILSIFLTHPWVNSKKIS